MLRCLMFISFSLLSNQLFSQTEIDVIDVTLKIGGFKTEELLLGFAEGDKIVFNMIEKDGKEIKEVTINEYPSNIKYQNREIAKIENKILNVTRKAIYQFSFYNANIKARTINVKIKRISPSIELNNFNTKVVWRNAIDTTYRVQQKQYLIKSDTSFVEVINTEAVVHTPLHESGNKSLISFVIPQNTVSWAYWIGVGQEAKKAYQKDVQKLASLGSKFIGGTYPLAGLLLGVLPTLSKSNVGENVKYYFLADYENAVQFKANQQFLQFKNADVITDYGIMRGMVNQQLYLGLYNDNALQAIPVNVKITAMVVNNKYETRTEKVPVMTNVKKPFIEE